MHQSISGKRKGARGVLYTHRPFNNCHVGIHCHFLLFGRQGWPVLELKVTQSAGHCQIPTHATGSHKSARILSATMPSLRLVPENGGLV